MGKITRAFVIEAPQRLNEKGLIKKIVGAFGGKDKEPADAAPQRAHNTERHAGETAVDQLLDRVFVVPSNDSRAVLLLNAGDLKDLYLKKGGEKELADALTEEQLAGLFPAAKFQIQGKPARPFLTFFKEGKFTTAGAKSQGDRNIAVLLNVPKSVATSFATKTPTNMEEARKLFATVINHMYYVGALDANRVSSVKIDATTSSEERAKLFDIKKFIRAWPQRSIYDAAVEEQQEAAESNKPLPDPEPRAKADTEEPKPKQTALSDAEQQEAQEAATEARRALNAATAKTRKEIEQQTGKQSQDQLPTTKAGRRELKDALEKILFNPSMGEKVAKAARQEFANSIRKTGFLDGIRDILQRDIEGEDAPETEPAAGATKTDSPEEFVKMLDGKDDDFVDQVTKILAKRKGAVSETTVDPISFRTGMDVPPPRNNEVKLDLKRAMANLEYFKKLRAASSRPAAYDEDVAKWEAEVKRLKASK